MLIFINIILNDAFINIYKIREVIKFSGNLLISHFNNGSLQNIKCILFPKRLDWFPNGHLTLFSIWTFEITDLAEYFYSSTKNKILRKLNLKLK